MFVVSNAVRLAFDVGKQSHGFLKLYSDAIAVSHIRFMKDWHDKYGGDQDSAVSKRDEVEKLGLRSFMKKHRQYAQFNYQEWRYPEKQRAIDISCTREVADPYKVDEGSSMLSSILKPRDKLKDIRDDIISNRLIKKRVPSFHRKRFHTEAQDIYLEVHNLLNTENWTITKKPDTLDRLDKLVTEHAYATMTKGLSTKTLRWKYIETIEPPRVVKIRTPTLLEDNNFYGQVTVRFHSKQTLAVYDRFGRLMFGSPDVTRNILEYVVFERHVSNPYGMWRIHAKIPANLYREPTRRTVAVMKPNVLREESKEWHEKEMEKCSYKWYPIRHNILKRLERSKKVRKGKRYYSKLRKYRVLCVKRTRPSKIRNKTQTLVNQKKEKINEMRKSGELPYPPNEPNP